MARTPLARWLRGLVREAREARARGISTEALRDEKSARPTTGDVSRRRFLAASAAGAAGASVLGASSIARATAGREVAIVGAGIAGLSCALELADHGVGSTIYESSGRVGGRIFSNTSHWRDGQVSEWMGELIDTGHETMQALATRFGLELDDLLSAQPRRSTDTYYFAGARYSADDAERDFRAIFPAIEADLEAAGYPTTYDEFTATGASLDATSVYDYIESRVPGGHDAPLGMLLDLAYTGEYGADSDDQSSLNLLYLLGFQPRPRGFAVFGESDEALHIRGGNEQLPRAIAAHLGEHTLRTSHRLVRIRETSGRRYELTFDRAGRSVDVIADHVVLALPFSVLRTIDTSRAGFDALKHTAIRELGAGRNAKVQLQFRSRLWNQRGPWGISNGSSYADTGYSGGWDVTRAQPGERGILVCYSGGSAVDALRTRVPFATQTRAQVQADAADALVDLAPVFPGLPALYADRATVSVPHLSEHFRASYAYYRVGQYTTFGGHEKVRQGNVYFAGEHTSGDFQGFMEGGATEGQRAARQVLRRL